MVDDDVLLPDGGEAVAAMLADAFREARRVRLELQVRPVDADELRDGVDAEHAGDDVHLGVGDRERPLHEVAQRFRHALLDLEPDHDAAAALLQRALEEAHEVFRLFLHLDVGIADDPERALPGHLVAGEEPRDEKPDGVLKKHEAERTRIVLARKLDEAIEPQREAHQRLHRAALLARESCSASVKPRLGMKGNGCAGSMASGVSTGKMESRKWPSSQPSSSSLSVSAATMTMPASASSLAQRLPVGVLLQHQLDDLGVDGAKLLRRREPVVAQHGDQLARLAGEAGDAHHHEFVEVVSGDRKEAQPLQRRMVGVLRFLQNPPIELEPGDFAVDEARRARRQLRVEPDGRLLAAASEDGIFAAASLMTTCPTALPLRPALCHYDDSYCRSANASAVSAGLGEDSGRQSAGVIRRPAESAARSSASTSRTAALSERSMRAMR